MKFVRDLNFPYKSLLRDEKVPSKTCEKYFPAVNVATAGKSISIKFEPEVIGISFAHTNIYWEM